MQEPRQVACNHLKKNMIKMQLGKWNLRGACSKGRLKFNFFSPSSVPVEISTATCTLANDILFLTLFELFFLPGTERTHPYKGWYCCQR